MDKYVLKYGLIVFNTKVLDAIMPHDGFGILRGQ